MPDRCVTTLHVDDDCVLEIQETRTGPGQARLGVVGEIDHSTYALLHTSLVRTWESRPASVTIDLQRVTFLNAGGLRVLLLTSRTARLRRVPLVLEAAPGLVTRLLTAVGLGEQLLDPHADAGARATAPAAVPPGLHLVLPLVERDGEGPPATVPGRRSAASGWRPELRSVATGRSLRGVGGAAALAPDERSP